MSTQLVDYFAVIGASSSKKLSLLSHSQMQTSHENYCGGNGDSNSCCQQPPLLKTDRQQQQFVSHVLSRIHFQASLLDRYPLIDNTDSPLSNEISLFALPSGITVSQECALPTFFTFVLTGGDGARVYGCSLVFFEAVEDSYQLNTIYDMIEDEFGAQKSNDEEDADHSKKKKSKNPTLNLTLQTKESQNNCHATDRTDADLDDVDDEIEEEAHLMDNTMEEEDHENEDALFSGDTLSTTGTPVVAFSSSDIVVHFEMEMDNDANDEEQSHVNNNVASSEKNANLSLLCKESKDVIEIVDNVTNSTPRKTNSFSRHNKLLRRKPIYFSKSFCILSHYPLYSTFKLFLTELYRTSITPSKLPIERYVCNFVGEVPLPPQGRIQVQYSIGEKISMISRPPENELPLSDVNYEQLFQLFGIDNILFLLECILSEKQILIHSNRFSLLGTIADALTSLIYPFQWHHVYIPLLPRSCLEFLSAPVPFIMGTHTSFLKDLEMPREVVRVNIDNNEIIRSIDVPRLPERQVHKLKSMLSQYSIPDRQYDITEDKTDLDVAFNMAPMPDDMIDNVKLQQFPTQKVRLAFFRIFISLFQKYKHYLKLDVKVDNILNFEPDNHFKKSSFIRDQRESAKPFLRMFLETQAFQRFLLDRVMNSDLPVIRYFEESIQAKLNRSKFKLYKIPTPFLSDKSMQILNTVIAMTPDSSGLDTDATFVYPTIPRMNTHLFNEPRDYKHLVSMSDCASRYGETIMASWKTILSTLASLSNQVVLTEDQRHKLLKTQYRKSMKLKSLQQSAHHGRTVSEELDGDLASNLATSVNFAGAPLYVDISTAVNHAHPLSVFSKFHFDTQDVCPDCNFELSDADVKMGWSASAQEYRTTCPNCLGKFVPRFSVLFDNGHDERSDLSSIASAGVNPSPGTSPAIQTLRPTPRRKTHTRINSTFMMMSSYASSLHKIRYEYLSPVVLKKEVENLLKKDVSADERLFSNHPLIFWNLILHFRELSIPLNILIPQVDWKSVLRTLAEMRMQLEQEQELENYSLADCDLEAAPEDKNMS